MTDGVGLAVAAKDSFERRADLWQAWQALRAPLVLGLVLGIVWLVVTHETVLRRLITIQSWGNPFHRFYCAPLQTFLRPTLMQHDCFMYLPISVWSVWHQLWLFGYVVCLIIGLTVWSLVRGDTPEPRLGWKVWLLIAILAQGPWVAVLEGPRVRLLPVFIIFAVLTWCFIVLNLKAATAEMARRRWLRNLAEWTFPISDVAWFTFHQRRMGKRSGWLRFVPIASVVVALGAMMVLHVDSLQASVRLNPLPVRVFDPHQATCDEGGCWFAETVGHAAGLWRYHEDSRKATPVVRAQDLRSFFVAERGRWVYVYDGFEREVLKVDPEHRRSVWRVGLPSTEGVELVGDDDMIFAVSLSGSVTGIDHSGNVRFHRTLASRAWYPQAVGGGRVAFVSPETLQVRTVGMDASNDAVIPLPVSDGHRPGTAGSSADMPLIVGTTYVERSQTLYVATLWGEILRYEFTGRQWRSPIRRPPGIRLLAADGLHNLLFVYHHVGGYIDLLDLESGRRIERVTASVFGNALSLSPTRQVAMLSARGPGRTSLPPNPGGLYQLRYETLARIALRENGN